MATLEYKGKSYSNSQEIKAILGQAQVPFEQWEVAQIDQKNSNDDVLEQFDAQISRLKKEYGYVSADVVHLSPETPGLDALIAKFSKEHHHLEDEVRFTVDGEGIFEIDDQKGSFLKVTTNPGDLVIVPAKRRHLFYLTNSCKIRCIRLFQNQEGWEAIYKQDA